nr:bifunctional folylpolyglutamate synthase/dihydrofolate synthase [Chloroflexota bacterium]
MPISYPEALSYLYSLTNYEIKSTYAYAPQFFDLRRVERLLEALDNPHHKFQSVHIAGTKGKGSTCAMLASILKMAGYRTGLYISPHLHSFRERIQVNNDYIPEADFAALVGQIRPIAERDKELTTFEVATALAFAYFAQVGVDIAVVEVGLGGRLDATNVILPLVSIISTIGHDHMHILGKTLRKIATEKAGIIKEGVPVVSAPQEPAAMAVIERVASEKHAPLHAVGKDWQWRNTEYSLEGQEFTATHRGQNPLPNNGLYKELYIPLLGKHQLRNATVVLQTVEVLRSLGWQVSNTALRQGLRDVVWPARFEIMGRSPYFIVDGAHNVDSARCLAETLQQYFPNRKPWFVLAILSDKDIPAILHQLLPHARGATFTRSHHPRAADPEQLETEAVRYGIPTQVIADVGEATRVALGQADTDGLVVAAGSFSTAGEAREAWLRLHNMPLPPLDPKV